MKTLKILLGLALVAQSCLANERFDVYYISIGSTLYKPNPHIAVDLPKGNLPGAGPSAAIMSECLSKYANAKGITIISTLTQLFSRQVMKDAMQRIWDMMLKDKPTNPLLVIYYCGHAFSEDLTQSEFLLAGDWSGMHEQESFEELSAKNVFVPEIVKMIFTHSLQTQTQFPTPRYMLLLDCCRRQKQEDSLDMTKVKAAWHTQASTMQSLFSTAAKMAVGTYKHAERFADPIIYASDEMQTATLLPIPPLSFSLPALEGASYIGSLCRRTLLLLDDKMTKNDSPIDLETYVTELLEPNLDPQSRHPVTPYTTDRPGNDLFLVAEPPPPADFSAATIPIQDIVGVWKGKTYYGIRKRIFPKDRGGIWAEPLPYDSSNVRITIDHVEGNHFTGTYYNYFDNDSAHNHSRFNISGVWEDGKMKYSSNGPKDNVLQKYSGNFWVETITINQLSRSGDDYVIIGTSNNRHSLGGPYKYHKAIPVKKTEAEPVAAAPAAAAPAPEEPAASPVGNTPIYEAFKSRSINRTQTVTLRSNEVVLKFYDDGRIDGDSISIFLNGRPIVEHQLLSKTAVTIPLDISNFGNDVSLTIIADNLGAISPNTAALTIEEGSRTHRINLESDMKHNTVVRLKRK